MNIEQGKILLALARTAVEDRLTEKVAPEPSEFWLREKKGTFVTVYSDVELRGCMGSVHPIRPLGVDVRENAVAAALYDNRFSPVLRHELNQVYFEVSLLSALDLIDGQTEEEILEKLKPGMDGVLFECGRARATFLPVVWKSLPHAKEFLSQLKEKAGMPADFWSPEVRLSRYTVEKWSEKDVG